MRIGTDQAPVHLIVQQKHGAVEFPEFLFQRQQLPAITQRRLRHQAKLGKGIESHS